MTEVTELFQKLQQSLLAGLGLSILGSSSATGDQTEGTWLEMFNGHLPQRYRAAKGFVFDSEGDESDEIDVIIFDRQYSPLLIQIADRSYVPAESVYAVFEVKQAMNKEYVEYAGAKAGSVRSLWRTSVPHPSCRGCLRSQGTALDPRRYPLNQHRLEPSVREAFKNCLSALAAEQRLDLGCAASAGSFEVGWNAEGEASVETHPRGTALAFFLLRLLARLQALGTVPAIDYPAYERFLEDEQGT